MQELPKAFEPQDIEDKWRKTWEEQGCFIADNSSKKTSYALVMPPPNVTGVLHMGHALVNTLQDVLVRWKRMSGFEVLWVPGTDHAGIATQTVVERHLIKTEGKRRKDYSREEFLSHVWDWKEQSQEMILMQLKKLGLSCDWSRLCFTMDEERSLAVKTVFAKMFQEGLIYRGDYLVHWDPVTQTALADDEVEYEEKQGFLWHIRYLFKEDPTKYVVIATTRPETLLADTAVAVCPSDERYQHLIGKTLMVPLVGREVPLIADRHIDPTFGTGAVKVTPAHDHNDYEMGLTHNLPMINIMKPDGKMNEKAGKFAGLQMQEARAAIVEALQAAGLLEKVEPHTHRVGISYRSKAVIEPYLSKQWFVKMSLFKEKLRSLVETKKITLVPPHWESTYFHWIDNLRDWCISRQLWWGHRIPIWYHKKDPSKILCYAGEGLPPEVAEDPSSWIQEEDVLDTWFSSALWPFSVLGWPHKTKDLDKFYPNFTLVTGHDILFFWVARMILMGEYVMGEVPFHQTFLHGLIYGKSYWKKSKDGSIQYVVGQERVAYDLGEALPKDVEYKWEKMSKSKGNIIDPLEMTALYGTDAVRMALCASATQARQIDLDRRKFEEFKNFANKVWNGARFVLMNLQDLSSESLAKGMQEDLFTLEDQWIFIVLKQRIKQVRGYLQEYQFDKAASSAYDFFWNEFCAYYVEMAKPYLFGKTGSLEVKENKQKVLLTVFLASIRLLHPMTPFITEELFHLVKNFFGKVEKIAGIDPYTEEVLEALKASLCSLAPYPNADLSFSFHEEKKSLEVLENFRLLEEAIYAIRNIRAEMQLPPSSSTDLWVVAEKNLFHRNLLEENETLIKALVKVQKILYMEEEKESSLSAKKKVGDLMLVIPLPEELKEKEKARLVKEQDKLTKQLVALEEKLKEPIFLEKAPKEILEKMQKQVEDLRIQRQEIIHKFEKISC